MKTVSNEGDNEGNEGNGPMLHPLVHVCVWVAQCWP